jgi:hypothetical protein
MVDSHEEITSRMDDERERQAVDLACQMLELSAGKNYYIIKPAKKIAKTKEEASKSSDDGDILLVPRDPDSGGNQREEMIIEVKRLSEKNYMANFTDRASWKLPNFIVDGFWQFKNKKKKVYGYMCFNSPMTWVAIIKVRDTIHDWKKESKPGNGTMKDYYVLDPDFVEFREVTIQKETDNQLKLL